MKKLTLALLSGGISSEREVSLSSGEQVYEALDKEKYAIIRYDPKTDLQRLVSDASKIDAALIIAHDPQYDPEEIEGVEGHIHALADQILIHKNPQTGLEAKFSM